jgi:hypothetical protein
MASEALSTLMQGAVAFRPYLVAPSPRGSSPGVFISLRRLLSRPPARLPDPAV